MALGAFCKLLTEYVPQIEIDLEIHEANEGQWMRPTRTVIRWLKSHRDLTTLTQGAAWDLLDRRCRILFRKLRSACTEDEDEFALEWEVFWPKVRYLPGINTLELAYRHAVRADQSLPLSHGLRSKKFPTFIQFCAWQAHYRRDDPILLPCSALAAIFTTSAMTIQRMREFATIEGVIKLTGRGNHKARLADEFEFLWAVYDKLIGRKK